MFPPRAEATGTRGRTPFYLEPIVGEKDDDFPGNPLPCGCCVAGVKDEAVADGVPAYKDIHVRHCKLHAAARRLADAVDDLLGLWPLSGYELEAYMDNTFIPDVKLVRAEMEGK